MNRIRTQRRTSRFILLLYLAVLGITAFHHHGHGQSLFGSETVAQKSGASSSHHSTTSYSACIMVAFANSAQLTVNNYAFDSGVTVTESKSFENNKILSEQKFNIPLFRGPPSYHI